MNQEICASRGPLNLHDAPRTIGRLTGNLRGGGGLKTCRECVHNLSTSELLILFISSTLHFIYPHCCVWTTKKKQCEQRRRTLSLLLSGLQGRLPLRCCISRRFGEWFDYNVRVAPLLPSLTNKYFSNTAFSSLCSRVPAGVNLHTLSLLSLSGETSQSSSLTPVCAHVRACVNSLFYALISLN